MQGSDGYFYGTTPNGGTNNLGTIFRISPSGIYTTIHNFVGSSPKVGIVDGTHPSDGLVQGSDGYFYGTAQNGGTNNFGTVFSISASGTYTTLHCFVGSPNEGANPKAGLVQGIDSWLYGTTRYGGTNSNGTIFRISQSGSCTTLYFFAGFPDGANPVARLLSSSDGYLYGTTLSGGTNGYGTVFRINPSGVYTTIYSFVGHPNDGLAPLSPLVEGSDGYFYGTTFYGGTNDYCCPAGEGTVFRISPSGSETILHSFVGTPNEGEYPVGGLVQGSDGYFYGTTEAGGTSVNCGSGGCGTLFRISPNGSFTLLHSFDTAAYPMAELVQGTDGCFYGTTFNGGTNNWGAVFKLSVPLNPPANQISAIQVAGNDAVISIPSVAGETYQLQFSSSMNPTNWSNIAGASVSNSIGAMLTLTNYGGALSPQGFYRFSITP
jgi:uncharacterized repeat protein (TIGR03803 family)